VTPDIQDTPEGRQILAEVYQKEIDRLKEEQIHRSKFSTSPWNRVKYREDRAWMIHLMTEIARLQDLPAPSLNDQQSLVISNVHETVDALSKSSSQAQRRLLLVQLEEDVSDVQDLLMDPDESDWGPVTETPEQREGTRFSSKASYIVPSHPFLAEAEVHGNSRSESRTLMDEDVPHLDQEPLA
ncbi:MAG: hypothetical protein Q9170_006319, partial [Blastenia crenularia]